MARNFLPFARRERVQVYPSVNGRPQRTRTRFSNLRVGGGLIAHLEDALIWRPDYLDLGMPLTQSFINGFPIKMRVGIDGRGFLTENLYDLRVFKDGTLDGVACWDWSGKDRTRPYRLYPGQFMRAQAIWAGETDFPDGRYYHLPAVLFNCVKVTTREPWLLYARSDEFVEVTISRGEYTVPGNVALWSAQLHCLKDSPLDIYSVTVISNDSKVRLWDGVDRPFWDSDYHVRIIDPVVHKTLLSMGKGSEWDLEMDETIIFEFESPVESSDLPKGVEYMLVDVVIRGTLEVEDGR